MFRYALQGGWADTFFLEWHFFQSLFVFLIFICVASAIVGFLSKSALVASMSGFLMFVHMAIETGNGFLRAAMYVALVVIFIVVAMQIWTLSTGGESPQ